MKSYKKVTLEDVLIGLALFALYWVLVYAATPAYGELWQYRDEPQVEYGRVGQKARCVITHIYPHQPLWKLYDSTGEVVQESTHDVFYVDLTEEWQDVEVSFPWDDGEIYYITSRIRLNNWKLEVEPITGTTEEE